MDFKKIQKHSTVPLIFKSLGYIKWLTNAHVTLATALAKCKCGWGVFTGLLNYLRWDDTCWPCSLAFCSRHEIGKVQDMQASFVHFHIMGRLWTRGWQTDNALSLTHVILPLICVAAFNTLSLFLGSTQEPSFSSKWLILLSHRMSWQH